MCTVGKNKECALRRGNENAIGWIVAFPGFSLNTAKPKLSYSGSFFHASFGNRKRSSSREKSFETGTKDASKSPTVTTSSLATEELADPTLSLIESPCERGRGKPESIWRKKSETSFRSINCTSFSPAGVLTGKGRIIARSVGASSDML